MIIFCETNGNVTGRKHGEVCRRRNRRRLGDVEGGIDPWHLFLWPQYSDGALARNLFLFLNSCISSI
jgi:hypothetical protein